VFCDSMKTKIFFSHKHTYSIAMVLFIPFFSTNKETND
jgi:hypothetical protein